MENFMLEQLKFKFIFEENSKKISVLDTSSLLYDFNLLYDLVVLSTVEDYSEYKFSRYFWYRKGRKIKPSHKLYLGKLKHESPLEITTILSIASTSMVTVYYFIQILEKIQNWNLDRNRLKLEIENLRLKNDNQFMKNRTRYLENYEKEKNIDSVFKNRGANEISERLVNRIEESPFRVVDATLFQDNENGQGK